MKRVVSILGIPDSGLGVAFLAKEKGFAVKVCDKNISSEYQKILEKNNIVFEEGDFSESLLSSHIIVRSAHISEKLPIMKRIREEGVRVVSELEFAATFAQAPIIAVGGTNGKSTTVALIAFLLEKAGRKVGKVIESNVSFAQAVLQEDLDYFVVEAEHRQLDDVYDFKPNIAVMLNIIPENLQRYNEDLLYYIDTNFRLIQNLDEFDSLIYNAEDEAISNELAEGGWELPIIPIKLNYFVDEKLVIPAKTVGNNPKYVFEDLPLLGKHNQINMAAAVLTALQLGVSQEIISESLPMFRMPRRMQKLTEYEGIMFVNDSASENLIAVKAAFDCIEDPIIWIVGGKDSTNDYSLIEKAVKSKVQAIIAFEGSQAAKFFKGKIKFLEIVKTMQEAIDKALEQAEEGDYVLYSPASRDNFEQSDEFDTICMAF